MIVCTRAGRLLASHLRCKRSVGSRGNHDDGTQIRRDVDGLSGCLKKSIVAVPLLSQCPKLPCRCAKQADIQIEETPKSSGGGGAEWTSQACFGVTEGLGLCNQRGRRP